MGIILKIFSGPHLGAEVPLTPGATTLGSSRSCDLVIQDSSVAERHLCLVVPDVPDAIKEITIKTIDAPVTLFARERDGDTTAGAGRSTDQIVDPGADQGKSPDLGMDQDQQSHEQRVEGEASWEPLTPLMLGTTCLAWKLDGQTWGDFAPSTGFSGKAFLREKQTPVPGSDAEKSQDATVAGQPTASAQKVVLPPIFAKILKYVGILFLFLLIFGPCMGTNDTKLARDMKHVLEKQGFEYLAVTQTNIGVTVSGVVATQEDRGQLWKIAGGMDYPVFINIRVNEERAFAVKVALSVRGLFPEVELDEKNVLIKGYMRDKLIEGASKIWIRNDIFEVDKIDSAMVYAFQVWPVLKDRLISHKLENLVTIRFHPGLVQVEGELDFDQRQTLETVKGEVCDRLSSPIAFWDTLTAPGFSAEWNSSLNSGMRSKFSPDPALAQLFLDSQSAKGIPAFVASTPALRAGQDKETGMKQISLHPGTSTLQTPVSSSAARFSKEQLDEMVEDAKLIKDSRGEQLAVIQDKDGKVLGALIPDGQGDFERTPSGEPLLLPVIRDKDGKLLRDKKGNLVFAEPLRNDKGNILLRDKMGIARDDLGRVLVDEQGRPIIGEVLRNEDGTIQRDEQGRVLVKNEQGEIVPATPLPQGAAKDDLGRVLVDDQGRPVMGEVLRAEDGTIQRDEQGRVLVKNEQGEIVPATPLPQGAAKDDLGRVLVDDQGRPVMGEVLRTEDGTIQRDKQGRVLVKNEQGEIVPATPLPQGAAKDDLGRVLVDDQGRPVMGEVLRTEDGTIQRDKQGRVLVKNEQGEIVPATPLPQGAAKDDLGRVLVDDQGRPVMGEVLRTEDGTIQRDKQGRVLVKNEQGEIVPATPLPQGAAKDDLGRVLVDEQGRPVMGEVLRTEDGTIQRDEQGRVLVKNEQGEIVPATPLPQGAAKDDSAFAKTQVPIMTGPVMDGKGNVVYDKNGKPIMGRVALDRDGEIVTDADGNPVVLGVALDEKGKPMIDADGRVVPLTIARDSENRVVRDKRGNPLLVPAILDRDGRLLRDEKGKPVAPRVITGADGKAVLDRNGNLILDQDAHNVLLPPDAIDNNVGVQPGDTQLGSEGSNMSSGVSESQTGGQFPSDKNIFGSGTVVADRLNQEKEVDPLGGLSIVSITLKPIPFVSMKDGQKFFTGGKLPGGYVIKSIATDHLVLERQGKTKTLKMRHD